MSDPNANLMSSGPKFLIVDFHPESRMLLARTLLRKFPDATVEECDELQPAVDRVRQGDLAAVITHRTYDDSGAELVRQFRHLDPALIIVMVSGTDRAEAARQAGADTFLHYDEWLCIGTVVQGLLDAKVGRNANGPAVAT